MGEVKEPSGGYPTNIMGALAMDHSALQGHDCAATLSQEMWTMFRMISDQDLAHPAWRWQCRRLHSATRQQRRVLCGTHTNIYVSGELRNRSQSLITIQRTHNYEDQDHVNAKLE